MSKVHPLAGGGAGGGGVAGLTTANGGDAIADNEIIRGDGATGIQGSVALLSDAGALSGVTAVTASGTVSADKFDLGSDGQIRFYDNPDIPIGTPDVGIKRTAAGRISRTDGGAGTTGEILAGALGATDNAALRSDGTGAGTAQGSALIVGDVAGASLPVSTTPGNALALAATAPTAAAGASQPGKAASLAASDAVASTDTAGAAAGGSVTITTGTAARFTSGNANGGDINLNVGAGIGTGTAGKVNTTATLVTIGGTTSSFPALKRNGVRVEVRLADDSALSSMTLARSGDSLAFGGLTSADVAIRTSSSQLFEFVRGDQLAYANIAAARLTLGGTTVGLFTGAGTPEGAVTAGIGSIFLRTDGGAATSIYVKESGAGNTGWVAK